MSSSSPSVETMGENEWAAATARTAIPARAAAATSAATSASSAGLAIRAGRHAWLAAQLVQVPGGPDTGRGYIGPGAAGKPRHARRG